MEPAIDLNCSVPSASLSPAALIWQDVLSQAMTGELVAAMNYTALSEICDDPVEVADALEHAKGEKRHAAAFAAEGRKIGVDVPSNVDAKHWKRLRDAFLRCITERDFIGCLIVQEVMLESFAGISTGAGYKNELLKWNYEQQVSASEFQGRKIDLVVEPKIFIESGLIP